MTGKICPIKPTLHEGNKLDLTAAESGENSVTPAETFPSRHPHNPNKDTPEPQLKDNQAMVLMKLVREGNFDARQNLITRNLRLVLDSNRHYSRKGIRIFELLEAGNLGLAHALENFEREGGECFATYADQCIRRNIEHAIRNRDGHSPARFGKSNHEHYRIVSDDDAEPSAVRLVLDSVPHTDD